MVRLVLMQQEHAVLSRGLNSENPLNKTEESSLIQINQINLSKADNLWQSLHISKCFTRSGTKTAQFEAC